MSLREFRRSDNLVLRTWFHDLELQKWLESPWTEQELDAIEAEENSRLWVLENNGKIVASIGCYVPSGDVSNYTISEVSVDPVERGKGYAKTAITTLLSLYGPNNAWSAYCHVENMVARNLFERLGWKAKSQKPDSHNYLTYKIIT